MALPRKMKQINAVQIQFIKLLVDLSRIMLIQKMKVFLNYIIWPVNSC